VSDKPHSGTPSAGQVSGLEAAAAAIASLIQPNGAEGRHATSGAAGDTAGAGQRRVAEAEPSGDAQIRARRAGKITA